MEEYKGFKVGDKVKVKTTEEMNNEGHQILNPKFQEMFGGQTAVIQEWFRDHRSRANKVKLQVKDNYNGVFHNPSGRICAIKKCYIIPDELFEMD